MPDKAEIRNRPLGLQFPMKPRPCTLVLLGVGLAASPLDSVVQYTPIVHKSLSKINKARHELGPDVVLLLLQQQKS